MRRAQKPPVYNQLQELLRAVPARFSEPLNHSGTSSASGSGGSLAQRTMAAAAAARRPKASTKKGAPSAAAELAQPAVAVGGLQLLPAPLTAAAAGSTAMERHEAVRPASKGGGAQRPVTGGPKRGRHKHKASSQRQLQRSLSRRSSQPVSVCVSRVHTPKERRRAHRRRAADAPKAAADLVAASLAAAAAALSSGLLGTSVELKLAGAAPAASKPGAPPVKQGGAKLQGSSPGKAAPVAAAAAAAGPGAFAATPLASSARSGGGSRSKSSGSGGGGGSGSRRQPAGSQQPAPWGSPAASDRARRPSNSPKLSPAMAPISAAAPLDAAVAASPPGPALVGMAVVGGGCAQRRRQEAAGHVARSQPFEPKHLGVEAVEAAAASAVPVMRPASRRLSHAGAPQPPSPPQQQQQQQAVQKPTRAERMVHPARRSPFQPSRPPTGATPVEAEERQGSLAGHSPTQLRQLGQQQRAPLAGQAVQRGLGWLSPSPSRRRHSDAGAGQDRQEHRARTLPFKPSSRPATGSPGPQQRQQQQRQAPAVGSPVPSQGPVRGTPPRPSTVGSSGLDRSPGRHLQQQQQQVQQQSPLRPPTSQPGAGLQAGLSPRASLALLQAGLRAEASWPPPAASAAGAVWGPESSWAAGDTLGGSSTSQGAASSSLAGAGGEGSPMASDAAAELASWLRGVRMAQLPPPTRLLECLPKGLEQDLFLLLLRQRQYVGSKAPQAHARKMRRLRRRLSGLERRWREHPVHQRISQRTLQAIGTELAAAEAAAVAGAPPRPATSPLPGAAEVGTAPAAASPAARSPAPRAQTAAGSSFHMALSPVKVAGGSGWVQQGGRWVQQQASPARLATAPAQQGSAQHAASSPMPPASGPFDFCFAGMRRQAAAALQASSSNGDGGAATPIWSAANGGGGSGSLFSAAAADGALPPQQPPGMLHRRSATPSPSHLTLSPASAAASPRESLGAAALARPSTSAALPLAQAPAAVSSGQRPATATSALLRLKSTRAAAQRPQTVDGVRRTSRLAQEASSEAAAAGLDSAAEGLETGGTAAEHSAWVPAGPASSAAPAAAPAAAVGSAGLLQPGSLLLSVDALEEIDTEGLQLAAAGHEAAASEPQLSYGSSSRRAEGREPAAASEVIAEGSMSVGGELPSALVRLKTARQAGMMSPLRRSVELPPAFP